MGYRRHPIPFERRHVLDAMRLGEGRHIMHALLDVDVTEARRRIAESDEDLSFTGYVTACIGRAVAAHPITHAYRTFRGDLMSFDEVDVSVIVEVKGSEQSFPMPLVLRGTESRSVIELTAEIRDAQRSSRESANAPRRHWYGYLPGRLRRAVMRLGMRNVPFLKKTTGTVICTSVGMFGDSPGYGIAYPAHYTTTIVVGSITEAHRHGPEGEVIPTETLRLTLSFDHDIVDGGPAARFCQDLVDMMQSGDLLANSQSAEAPMSARNGGAARA